MFIFDLFEYVTNPKVKILDEPLIEVIELDSEPPVQDSAKDTFKFSLIKYLTTFLESFFMMKLPYIKLELPQHIIQHIHHPL